MIYIDGSFGEGGGQILRSSLGLALVTGKAFTITNIRANRKKPGLLRQHLTAVNAAAELCGASLVGAAMGSAELRFEPGSVVFGGRYTFSVGTAGSACLVCQAVLPGLLSAAGSSTVTFEGGTHNPWAPPFHFVNATFLPLLWQMGFGVEANLERYGFYPGGGGRFTVSVTPAAMLQPLQLVERGESRNQNAMALVANLPRRIGDDEIAEINRRMPGVQAQVQAVDAEGPGNLAMIQLQFDNVTELMTGFGTIGVSRCKVARQVVQEAQSYLKSGAAVGAHLADQLLIPVALAGGGQFTTVKPTQHTLTNIEVIKHFLDINLECTQIDSSSWLIKVGESGQ